MFSTGFGGPIPSGLALLSRWFSISLSVGYVTVVPGGYPKPNFCLKVPVKISANAAVSCTDAFTVFNLEPPIRFVKLDFHMVEMSLRKKNTLTKPRFPPCFRFFCEGPKTFGFCWGVKKKRWKPSSHCVNCCFVLQAILVGRCAVCIKKQKQFLGGGFKYFLYFHPYLGKIPILTNIFQMGWNHQPEFA